MRLLKYLFSVAAYYLHLWPLVFWLLRRKKGRPALAVFTFHRVLRHEPRDAYLQGYERGCPRAEFERQIDAIARACRIIDYAEFTELAEGRRTPPSSRPVALLTFDDADIEFPVALEKLTRHGYAGVMFVPTGFVDTDRRFYHLRLTNICNHLTDPQWREILASDIPEDVRSVLSRHSPHIRQAIQAVRRELIDPFHEMRPAERDALLDRWERLYGIEYDLGIGCLSWDEIRSLLQTGIELGSHSVDHNRLTLLDRGEALTDLVESREVLQRETGQEVTSFCYPEGSYDATSVELCSEAGYRYGFISEGGFADYPFEGNDRFRVARMGVGMGTNHRMAWSIGVVALKELLGRD